jgi:hypothetical protein
MAEGMGMITASMAKNQEESMTVELDPDPQLCVVPEKLEQKWF